MNPRRREWRGVGAPSSMSTMDPEIDRNGRLCRARIELERQIRAGEPVGVEDWFQAEPALADDPDSALELIYAEYMVRDEVGRPVTLDALCAGSPAGRATCASCSRSTR